MTSSETTRILFFPTAAIASIFVAAAAGIASNRRTRREQRRQRRAISQLRRLDDHTLRDIGFDRTEIASVIKYGRKGR